MNFVFHHHLAHRDLPEPAAAVGAMLPDLWRMADPRVKAKPAPDLPNAKPAVRLLLAGVDHHLALDQRFHRHPLLAEGERYAADLFEVYHVEGEKMALLAHIAWELALDGALLHRLGLEPTKQLLQDHVASLDPADLEAALVHHHPTFAQNEAAREQAQDNLLALLDQLTLGEWIDGYQHGHGLERRLAGVRRRVGLPPLGFEDQYRAANALDDLLIYARKRLDVALAV